MQYFVAILVAFCALVSTAPFTKRDLPIVLNDLSLISSNVTAFDTLINAYTGASNQSSTIETAFASLDGIVKTATTDTSNSADFDEVDSEAIANAITALAPVVIKSLEDLTAKYDTVAVANRASVVVDALQTLMADSDALLTAFTDKVTEEQTNPIGTAADQINYAFTSTINQYEDPAK